MLQIIKFGHLSQILAFFSTAVLLPVSCFATVKCIAVTSSSSCDNKSGSVVNIMAFKS